MSLSRWALHATLEEGNPRRLDMHRGDGVIKWNRERFEDAGFEDCSNVAISQGRL